MRTFEVESDEKLFREWKALGKDIEMLASLVQNDMEIDSDQFMEWKKQYSDALQRMNKLYLRTVGKVMQQSKRDYTGT